MGAGRVNAQASAAEAARRLAVKILRGLIHAQQRASAPRFPAPSRCRWRGWSPRSARGTDRDGAVDRVQVRLRAGQTAVPTPDRRTRRTRCREPERGGLLSQVSQSCPVGMSSVPAQALLGPGAAGRCSRQPRKAAAGGRETADSVPGASLQPQRRTCALILVRTSLLTASRNEVISRLALHRRPA
jgi:hypothetical protein